MKYESPEEIWSNQSLPFILSTHPLQTPTAVIRFAFKWGRTGTKHPLQAPPPSLSPSLASFVWGTKRNRKVVENANDRRAPKLSSFRCWCICLKNEGRPNSSQLGFSSELLLLRIKSAESNYLQGKAINLCRAVERIRIRGWQSNSSIYGDLEKEDHANLSRGCLSHIFQCTNPAMRKDWVVRKAKQEEEAKPFQQHFDGAFFLSSRVRYRNVIYAC